MKFQKGHKTWIKGKNKIDFPQLSNSGVKKGNAPWNKGIKTGKNPKHSEKMKLIAKEKGFGKWMKGRNGEKSHFWKGGISKIKGYGNFYKYRHNARKKGADGNHTLGEWETLKAQYNWTCPCCHKSEPEIKLTEDHIIPLSKGGSDNIENIQPLCRSCNCKKLTKIIKFYVKNISEKN